MRRSTCPPAPLSNSALGAELSRWSNVSGGPPGNAACDCRTARTPQMQYGQLE